MSSKSDPTLQEVDKKVVLKGEKGLYNELLRPSEREDAYILAGDKVGDKPVEKVGEEFTEKVANLQSRATDRQGGKTSKS